MKDPIERQAAIDAVKKLSLGETDTTRLAMRIGDYLERLPSAQPKIIRCKDCKHWDGVDTCDVIDAPVWDNDFCSMAERRSDEE